MNITRRSAPEAGSCHRRAGFTLVELMVVIATLAVLAALMLPALAGTKSNSTLLQCLNNQKQLATAWLMYNPDNNDNVIGFNCSTTWCWRLGVSSVTATPPAGLVAGTE